MNIKQVEDEIIIMKTEAEQAGAPMSAEHLCARKCDLLGDSLKQYLLDIHELSGIAFRNYDEGCNESFDCLDVQAHLRIIKQMVSEGMDMVTTLYREKKKLNKIMEPSQEKD